MAPIHHHFEMMEWTENKIIVRFWIMAAIFGASGFVLYYLLLQQVPVSGSATWWSGLRRSGLAACEAIAARVARRRGGRRPTVRRTSTLTGSTRSGSQPGWGRDRPGRAG